MVALTHALHAKVFCSEAAVDTETRMMRVVGIDSYDQESPLTDWLQHVLVLPLFGGGRTGVQQHQPRCLLQAPDYHTQATWHDGEVTR